MTKQILVTGAAGFIGAHLSKRLVEEDYQVTGLDNLNDYYDVALKESRLDWVKKAETKNGRLPGSFNFIKLDLVHREAMTDFFEDNQFNIVVNLAAQGGVRHSIDHPLDYIDNNLLGFAHVLEGCRKTRVNHLVYASSSSVYGANTEMPYSVQQNVDHPLSIYAASKKANELMAHSYASLYGLPATGLRFFTVYGPWGRPDMAPMLFTRKILKGESIDVFNHGNYSRDFTYIDDIIEGIVRVINNPPQKSQDRCASPATSKAPWRVFNIGNGSPVILSEFINTLEQELGMEARKNMMPAKKGEVETTWADVSDLNDVTGFVPNTPLESGVRKFVRWYRAFYKSQEMLHKISDSIE